MNENPCRLLLHNKCMFLKNCGNYKFPNWILVTCWFCSFFFSSVTHYVKQVGSGLEIVKTKDIKWKEKTRKRLSSFSPLSNVYFFPFIGVKAENFTFLVHCETHHIISPMRRAFFFFFSRYFLNTFCGSWVFF